MWSSKIMNKFSRGSQEDPTFPDSLAGFGYSFQDGKLRNIETGRPFEFVVRVGDQAYNQKHYEALGEVVTEEVYKLLETECGLTRAKVPYNCKEDEPHTFIFVSKDVMTNDKLMVLIHGSGVVRAGQWARRLIINDTLDSGTQIPYIKRAMEDGYAVLVMNTNDNFRINKKKKQVPIRGSESPERHAVHVWKYYLQGTQAKYVALVAHSFGGCVTTALFETFKEEFQKRVFAVAMTDSVHFIYNFSAFKELVKISRNWVRSQQQLGTKLETKKGDIQQVSSGVRIHEETSWASIDGVFEYFRRRYDQVVLGASKTQESSSHDSPEDSGDDSPDLADSDAGGGGGAGPAGGRRDRGREGEGRGRGSEGGGGGGERGKVEEEEEEEEGRGKKPRGKKIHDMSDSGNEGGSDGEAMASGGGGGRGREKRGEKGRGRGMKKGQKKDVYGKEKEEEEEEDKKKEEEKKDAQMEIDEEGEKEMPMKMEEEKYLPKKQKISK
ncbi:cotranscriptional regulator ARB2A-like isoform X2 [Penaeus indicus]|uniref:cotranscriptional regulator ARB2A-like isoform X1 n=1 Tax=Penaeus indicus TaxID=29960 RepID=UPI00300C5FC1